MIRVKILKITIIIATTNNNSNGYDNDYKINYNNNRMYN